MLEKQVENIKKILEEAIGEDASVQLSVYFFRVSDAHRDKATALKIAGVLIEKLGSGVIEEEEHDGSNWVKVWDGSTSLIVFYDISLEEEINATERRLAELRERAAFGERSGKGG